ncbi:MAG: hypothetical protein IPP58_06175 [Holophagaceae bacterium]|uniref:Uncharacterized protein n=1 Tax=Candidatus Geothrix skivensis TaxID=2954439 RepID=A0A9D7SFR1_9BACT|nr:hypothetical protein [Candidatus Geothrix skivensis]
MPRTPARPPEVPAESQQGDGVVRRSMAIPPMSQTPSVNEAFEAPPGLPCSGRCGRCDIHPCKLHAPI